MECMHFIVYIYSGYALFCSLYTKEYVFVDVFVHIFNYNHSPIPFVI